MGEGDGWLRSFYSYHYFLSPIYNKKSASKIYNLKFYLKSKLNQVSVIALSNWQLLGQTSRNALIYPIILYLQANLYGLKTKNSNSPIFTSTLLGN